MSYCWDYVKCRPKHILFKCHFPGLPISKTTFITEHKITIVLIYECICALCACFYPLVLVQIEVFVYTWNPITRQFIMLISICWYVYCATYLFSVDLQLCRSVKVLCALCFVILNGILQCIWKCRLEMAAILSRPRCVELSRVTPPRRVSLHRQVCHHCLPWRLILWQPPPGPGVTSLPAYWRFVLGTPNCNECPNILLSTCSSVHVLLPLFHVIECHVMWLCIMNKIFVWTQVVNKLLQLLLSWLNMLPLYIVIPVSFLKFERSYRW